MNHSRIHKFRVVIYEFGTRLPLRAHENKGIWVTRKHRKNVGYSLVSLLYNFHKSIKKTTTLLLWYFYNLKLGTLRSDFISDGGMASITFLNLKQPT
ncbi:hypothetical protein [Flavobacterium sp. GCM10023249]|uniref:hypothetical protein n=1 Tax=unclassified Flavobacterium TaxID=196869 RepID=UPI0036213B6A